VDIFEQVQDMVEQIDQALNLHKMGKLAVIIDMLRDQNPAFRSHAAAIVATCTQNNPKVQKVAIEGGALAYAAHLLVHDENDSVRAKALWAVSCLIRNFPAGEGNFAQGDGVYVVCRGIRDADVRVRTKSLYLLSYLLNQDPALRTNEVVDVYGIKVQETGLCTDLVAMIGDESVDLREGVLQVLLKLLAVDSARTALLEAGLKDKVTSRTAQLSQLEGEEKEDAQGELDLLAVVCTSSE